jgi:uncharacterized protein (TIGR02271 family)
LIDAQDADNPLVAPKSGRLSADSTDERKLRLLAEELEVGKHAVETGRLRVSKPTHTREAPVDKSLFSEQAEVETIRAGRQIFEMPSVRQEGEVTIIPIVEEVLHTERRLFLKEEVRITRRRTTERFQDRVTLRVQEAAITRVRSATEPAGAESVKEMKSSGSRE